MCAKGIPNSRSVVPSPRTTLTFAVVVSAVPLAVFGEARLFVSVRALEGRSRRAVCAMKSRRSRSRFPWRWCQGREWFSALLWPRGYLAQVARHIEPPPERECVLEEAQRHENLRSTVRAASRRAFEPVSA